MKGRLVPRLHIRRGSVVTFKRRRWLLVGTILTRGNFIQTPVTYHTAVLFVCAPKQQCAVHPASTLAALYGVPVLRWVTTIDRIIPFGHQSHRPPPHARTPT
ncbi:unnamed protein product, partial [Pylaiella littoralis]